MLSKLFGYRVELIEHSSEYTLVKADSAVPVGTQIPVRVSGPNGRRTPSVPMVVVSCRASEHGGYLLAGKFLVDHPDLTGVEIPAAVTPDSFARSAPRVCCHLCVLSRDLPGFKVMTIDLSEGGLQVEAPSEVKLGGSVLLRLEFDTDRLPPIQATATVAWCSQQDRGRYRVGLQFNAIDERSKEIIALYRDLLARREQSDIQTRTLAEDRILASEAQGDDESTSLPCLQVIDWQRVPLMEGATLVGYMRAGAQLQVRLRGGCGGRRSREYVFHDLRGLRDNLDNDPTAREIAQFRYASTGGQAHRFQLLDGENEVLLEIEAGGCRERSAGAN